MAVPLVLVFVFVFRFVFVSEFVVVTVLDFPPSSAKVYIILFSMIDFAVDVTGVADRRRGTYNLVGTNIFFDTILYFCWQPNKLQYINIFWWAARYTVIL